ncbi:MAG: HAD-IC family P-type ATPase, partial [Synergistales bacterium]|nr:HAD-IC family P-type ATPase [Synergistales bacterium]
MAEKNDLSKLKRSIRVTGMTCATCSRIVERSLKKVEGVSFAAVNLATETAFVVVDDESLPQEKLEEAIVKAGYGFSYAAPEELESRRYREARHNLFVSWAVTAPLMALMVLHMTGTHIPGYTLMELIGGLIVFIGAGSASFKGAWIALSHRHANMDVLVVFGSAAAWATALLHLIGLPLTSFGALGPMILALHITGRYIESHLRDRASKEIRALLAIQAREARIIDENGKELLVPIEAVKEGHRVLVRPGERFPADGHILEGRTSVDESMITGESLPVGRHKGAPVTGGSLNLTGAVTVEVARVGEDSFLAQMIALIQEAQGAKVPIQAFADRVMNVFVPIIVGLALIAALAWYSASSSLTFLLDGAGRFLPWV